MGQTAKGNRRAAGSEPEDRAQGRNPLRSFWMVVGQQYNHLGTALRKSLNLWTMDTTASFKPTERDRRSEKDPRSSDGRSLPPAELLPRRPLHGPSDRSAEVWGRGSLSSSLITSNVGFPQESFHEDFVLDRDTESRSTAKFLEIRISSEIFKPKVSAIQHAFF